MTADAIEALALLIADPQERHEFIVRACAGDLALQLQVEANFLARAAQPGTVMAIDATGGYISTATIGDRIDGYQLISEIGEGGMGTVWLAQQLEPVKRRVALKLIKAGMDSRAVLARFEAERQALALMDHPNIARVFDAGMMSDGRPFFVMELVRGVPITQFCDEKRLTPRQRLELFIPVCLAIQHAHQKGVIHRDIKPSNVLVTIYDDRPVPKVIDFGIAKATGQPLTEHTFATGLGMVVGTPQYMSPEQATLNNLDIDTRSDVYSLGVLLYELLTGSPPFSSEELHAKGVLEILRIVREEEPPRPSTRLSTTQQLPTLSANRNTDPRQLTAMLRGELDWIIMKALEKDRSRRYDSPTAFAADVQRYLNGEPVLAVPPSTGYRLRAFMRRHRVAVSMISLFVTTFVLMGIGMGIGYLERARQRETAANLEKLEQEQQQTKQALAKAEQARKDETIARADADRLRRDVVQSEAARTIELAFRSWQEGNLIRARELLESVPHDLRVWEWNYVRRLSEPKMVLIPKRGFNSDPYFSPDSRFILDYRHVRVRRGNPANTVRQMVDRGPLNRPPFVSGGGKIAEGPANPPPNAASVGPISQLFDASTGEPLPLKPYHADEQCLTMLDPVNPLMVIIDPRPQFERKTIVKKSRIGERIIETPIPWDVLKTTTPYAMRVIDPFTGAEVGAIDDLREIPEPGQASLSRDGQRLAVIRQDGTIAIHDTTCGEIVQCWSPHWNDQPIDVQEMNLLLSPNGETVLIYPGDRPGQAGNRPNLEPIGFVWDAITGQPRFKIAMEPTRAYARFSPDSLTLFHSVMIQVNGGLKRDMIATTVSTGREQYRIPLAIGATATTHVDCSNQSPMHVHGADIPGLWDSRTGQRLLGIRKVAELPPGVWRRWVGVAPNHPLLAVMLNGGIKVFSLNQLPEIELRFDHGPSYTQPDFVTSGSLVFSPDGHRLAFHDRSSTLRIWDLRDDPRFTIRDLGTRGVVDISPDQSRLIVTTEHPGIADPHREILDVRTGQVVGQFQSGNRRSHTVYQRDFFAEDGRSIVSITDDAIILRDPQTGAERSRFEPHATHRHALDYKTSPTGEREWGTLDLGENAQNITRPIKWPDVYEIVDASRQLIITYPLSVHAERTAPRNGGEQRRYTGIIRRGPDRQEVCRIDDLPLLPTFRTTPDGRFLFISELPRIGPISRPILPPIRIFDLSTGRETTERIAPRGVIHSFSADGRYALVSDRPVENNGAIAGNRWVWDLQEGKEVRDEFGRVVEDLSWFTGDYWRYRLSRTLIGSGMEVPALSPAIGTELRITIDNVGGIGLTRNVMRIYDGSPLK